MTVRWLIVLVGLGLFFGCKAGKQAGESTAKTTSTTEALTAPEDLPHANQGTLIQGTVVTVQPPTNQYEARNPCAEVPCQAPVRIDAVVRAGNGPAARLEEGKEVEMLFRFSLAPANTDLFPQLRVNYPGLDEQNRFEAVVDGRIGSSGYQYTVDHYLKLED